MQGHYAGACVEVSLMDILWGVLRHGCCANAVVTWRYVYELMERLYTLVQQDHGLYGRVANGMEIPWTEAWGLQQILDESEM